MALNETHDPGLRCWVPSAHAGGTDFPLQNLPFGVFRRHGSKAGYGGGIAIGDQILDLRAVLAGGAMHSDSEILREALRCAAEPTLNEFMGRGRDHWSRLRLAVSRALRVGSPEERQWKEFLVPMRQADLCMPARVGDYTDFYTSIYHATAVGQLLRPDNPLLPNYRWMPIGYHGRSSSIAVSGQEFPRPRGQIRASGSASPVLAPSQRLDYEMELGAWIGPGNPLGTPRTLATAEQSIFGLCLLNDWSARDLQGWEYQPLGPFLGKNFATTISPWIVTLEALEPYRVGWRRPPEDPQPLAYLDSAEMRACGALDIQLEVHLLTPTMRRAAAGAQRLSHSNARHAYWTVAQMLAHHTVNGCNLVPGDLLGTGTQSGPTPEEAGSLLELSQGGKQPLALSNGETRTFLQDGDTIIMRGWCEKSGFGRVGFGEVVGTVLPPREPVTAC